MNQLPELFKYFVGVLSTSYFLWYLEIFGSTFLRHLAVLGALSIFSWTVAWAIFERLNTETVAPGKKTVLVTGCDTGFGHDLARRLDQFGKNVL